MDDDLKSLMRLLTSPGRKPFHHEIYEYIAPLDRTAFELRRRWLNKALAFNATTRVDKGRKGHVVGKLYEKLVIAMLKDCTAITYKANVRSTTSEIDFLLAITPVGLQWVPMFAGRTHVLGEAKCYSSSPKTEWINELQGLMDSHSTGLAFLFLGCKSQKLMREIRTAIGFAAVGKKYIVPFGSKQVEEIAAGGNFLQIMSEQYVSAATHSDLHV